MIRSDQGQDSGSGGTGRKVTLGSSQSIDLTTVFTTLKRRMWLVISVLLIGTSLSYYILKQVTPVYSAAAVLVIDPRAIQAVQIDAAPHRLPPDTSYVQSQISAIRSPVLVEEVIKDLGLREDPEFNPQLRPRTGGVFEQLAKVKSLLSLGRNSEVVSFPGEDVDLIETILNHLHVWSEDSTYTVTVQFFSEDPKKAAIIANAIAEEYISEQSEALNDAKVNAAKWLKDRIDALRTSVLRSEEQAQNYRAESNLLKARGETLSSQQLAEISTQLILARSDRSQAQARLDRVRALQRSGKIEGAIEVLASPLIQRLREQEASLLREMAELSAEYGDRHPSIINKKSQIGDLRDKIEIEIAKIVESVQNELDVARSREESLAQSLAELEKQASVAGKAEVRLAELERQASTDRTLYESMLMRYKEIVDWERVSGVDVRVVAPAKPSRWPASPNIKLGLVAAGLIFGGFGIVLALGLEAFDRAFRSPQQIEGITGLPVVGIIPEANLREVGGDLRRYIAEKPFSAFVESLNSSLLFLHFLREKNAYRTVLITSALPEEGKTTFATALAIAAAQSGLLVALLDGDLRRGRVSQVLGLRNKFGLLDYLSDAAGLENIVIKDEQTSLSVFPAAGPSSTFGRLVRRQMIHKVRSLLRAMSAQYDLVIIDSAPIIAVADSSVLASVADATVLVARWGQSNQEPVDAAIRELRQSGANIVGIALTAVNLKKHASYGYKDAGSWNKQLRKYYQS